MDEFSYLSVLISVILGLAVTQILKGFRGIVLSRHRIKMYWPVPAWGGLLLLVCFQHWWAMFDMRHRQDRTFEQFGVVLLNVIFIYMAAGLVFPDFFDGEVVDLKENFYSHRGWFFALAVGTVLASIFKGLVLDRKLPPAADFVFQHHFCRDAVYRRVDSLRTLSQRSHRLCQGTVRSLRPPALRPRAIAVADTQTCRRLFS
jgi:hypothetical protein